MRENLSQDFGVIVLLMLAFGAVSAFFRWHRAAGIRQRAFNTGPAVFNFQPLPALAAHKLCAAPQPK